MTRFNPSAEEALSFLVQRGDWSQICLCLTQNKGVIQPTITSRRVCVNFFFKAWNQMHPTLAKGKHFRSSDAFTQMKEGNVQKSQKLKTDQFTELNSGWELTN